MTMSTEDTVEYAAHDAKGRIKEGLGAVTGDDELKNEGRGDQAAAHAKQKVDQVKDAASTTAHDAKGHFKEGVGTVTGDDELKGAGRAEQAAAEAKRALDK